MSSVVEGSQIAYLVLREGNRWRDVFRLTPGQVTTVGRAPTNRIVLRDEICSRNHCEVFQTGAKWTVRDLGSRNGTLIDTKQIDRDWELEEGNIIQIGSCDLGFTFDLSKSFPELDVNESRSYEVGGDTVDIVIDEQDSSVEPEITHRRRRTRYHPASAIEILGRDRISQMLGKLYQLAFDMAGAKDEEQLADFVLGGLVTGTGADIGAMLLLQAPATDEAKPSQLRVVGYKATEDVAYQKVSDYLSSVVLGDREAVLARDIADDSRLAGRDSLGEIFAKSVICAPIRTNDAILGLIHLYSTSAKVRLDPDDLEFTLSVADQLSVALENLKEKESLATGLARAQDEAQILRDQLAIESDLVGESSSMNQLNEQIALIAPTDATALIRGESGVGKELVARAIHFSSQRKNAPFVCMNCAALSETLLESELFGHEKGSFTGATKRKLGKFEQAHGGTLFLDEVGEMSLGIQAKFLRVLEGHQFERVGGSSPIEVDVRVVAATNRDLEEAIEEKKFRQDLYFRLYVVKIDVEPLRDRQSDIPILANYFLQKSASRSNPQVRGFTPEALQALMQHNWPGNVRELKNTVERTVILCRSDQIDASDIQLSTSLSSPSEPVAPAAAATSAGASEVSLEELEKQHILSTLDNTNWNKSKAAQILGIERSTLDRKLKRYNVTRPL